MTTTPARQPSVVDVTAAQVDVVLHLGQLALAFGQVDRATYHPDGRTHESDTDHTICAVVAFGETMSRDTRTGNEAEAFTELFQRAADWAAHRVACEDGIPVLRPYDRDFPTNAGSCVWCGKLPTEHIPRPAPVGIGDLYRALDEYLNAPYDVEAGLKELKARIVDEQHRVRPATLGVTREYPCPECGHDGPHPVVDQAADGVTCECVGCLAEFQIPAGG